MGSFLILAMLLAQAPPQVDRVDRALELIHQEKYEMAYQVLIDLVKDDPTNERAFPFLAAMELQTGRLADAENHINALVAHDPDNADLRELSAQLFMARRDWKKAEEQWRWIAEQRPNSAQAHMQLAAVLLQEDRYNDALAEVSRALEISPRRNDARSLRGNILATLGQINQAALDWNIALAGDPDDTVALSGLAVFLRQTDPDRALDYAQRAVDLTAWKSLGPMRVLAMVYRARGEEDKAKSVLGRAIMAFPNNETLAAEFHSDAGPARSAAPPSGRGASPDPPANTAAAKPPDKATTTVAAAPPAASSTRTVDAPPPPAAIARAADPPALPPGMVALPRLAVGGLTLGAAVSDLLYLERLPAPPAPSSASAFATAPAPSSASAFATAPAPSRTSAADSPPATVAVPVAPPIPKAADLGAAVKVVVPSAPPAKPVEPSAPPKATAVVTPPALPPAKLPSFAAGGLTLGAALSDLLLFDRLPSPPVVAPPVTSKPADSGAVAKAVVPSKPADKPAEPSVASKTTAPARTSPSGLGSPAISVASLSPLAFGGLTLGAALGDLWPLEKPPSPPGPEARTASVTPPSASKAVETPQVQPPLVPAASRTQQPGPDLHWGMIPLSTISPAFVYGPVPRPTAARRP
jgi:Tfp pilus assembly protein PilF